MGAEHEEREVPDGAEHNKRDCLTAQDTNVAST